jgi:hypothetical protein
MTVHGLVDSLYIKNLSKKTHRGLEGRALQDDLGRTRDRKVQLEKELGNLIGAMADTGHTPSMAEAIAERERELRTIIQHLLGNQQQAVMPQLSELRNFIIERLTNIRTLVTSDVERARVELAKHITGITLQPQDGHYEVAGEWNVLGNQRTPNDGDEMRVWMVAGDGFEPPTFGL